MRVTTIHGLEALMQTCVQYSCDVESSSRSMYAVG